MANSSRRGAYLAGKGKWPTEIANQIGQVLGAQQRLEIVGHQRKLAWVLTLEIAIGIEVDSPR